MELMYKGDCRVVLQELINKKVTVGGVIISPPYNMGKNPFHWKKGERYDSLYETYSDNMNEISYLDLIHTTFKLYEKILVEDGVILLVMSYSSKNAILPITVLNTIDNLTDFTLRDIIVWKKENAIPFQTSPTNLSRICEMVYVIARKGVVFKTNKMVTTTNERTNQKFYGTVNNLVEARNNDKHKGIKHNATFSKDLVMQLIEIYFPENTLILDSFMGLGTTGLATIELNRHFIGIELVDKYFTYANKLLQDARIQKDNADQLNQPIDKEGSVSS